MVRASSDCVPPAFQDSRNSLGMGEVLPMKRQTVVDRLRKRFELYRKHQNSCLPRYEQSSNALHEKQCEETLLLKQRFLESKAKKAKNKSEHHRSTAARESTPDGQKPHFKSSKRTAERSPLTVIPEPSLNGEEKATEAKQLENACEATKAATEQQHVQLPQTPTTCSFPAQVVPQFTNSNNSSQSMQTNVSVHNAFDSAINHNEVHRNANQVHALSTSAPQSQSAGVSSNHTCSSLKVIATTISDVECKQESKKCSNVCQFKNQELSDGGSSGDRLSDTFPTIGLTDDSGDDVWHPDILDLLNDVFTNPTDIMKEFNFDDSIGSVKANDSEKDDLDELVKDTTTTSVSQVPAVRSDGLLYSHSIQPQQPQQHQTDLFNNSVTTAATAIVASSSVPVMTSTTVPSTGNPLLHYSPHQGLISYMDRNATLTNSLGIDFKPTEPSPAALTLKQMAQQHQNMQKQQLGQSVISSNNRTQFDLDNFSNSVSNFRSRFLSESSASQKLQIAPASNIFSNVGYDSGKPFPGIVPISDPNPLFKQGCSNSGTRQLQEQDNQRQFLLQAVNTPSGEKKPPLYSAGRGNFFSGGANGINNHASNKHCNNNNNMGLDGCQQGNQRISLVHNPLSLQQVQIENANMKAQESAPQHFSNTYSYSAQQGNNNAFQMSVQQNNFHSLFGSHSNIFRPPPEYKTHQQNVSISSHILNQAPQSSSYLQQLNTQRYVDSSISQWRSVPQERQQRQSSGTETFQNQGNYGNLNAPGAMSSTLSNITTHHPYRTVNGQLSASLAVRPNVSPLMMQLQRQRVNLQNGTVSHMPLRSVELPQNISNMVPCTLAATSTVFSNASDVVSRQDGTQVMLDFLDIESSASDLLNFDQVMQNSGGNFSLLVDIDMLNK